jgi:hypothetical protein
MAHSIRGHRAPHLGAERAWEKLLASQMLQSLAKEIENENGARDAHKWTGPSGEERLMGSL